MKSARHAVFLIAVALVIWGCASGIALAAPGYSYCIYETDVEPIVETLVIPEQPDDASLAKVIDGALKPGTFIYLLNANPAEVSKILPNKVYSVENFVPTKDLQEVITTVQVLSDGRTKIGDQCFIGGKYTIKEMLDSVTKGMNEDYETLWNEQAAWATFGEDYEAGQAAAKKALSAPLVNPYYIYMGILGPFKGYYRGPGTNIEWGQTALYMSFKKVGADPDPSVDHWYVHARDDIRPGYFLGTFPSGVFEEQMRYDEQHPYEIHMSNKKPSDTNDNTVTVGPLGGWYGLPTASWTFNWYGDTYMGHWDSEVDNISGSMYAQWDCVAAANDTRNYDRIISVQPGWDQWEWKGDPCTVVVNGSGGSAGSNVSFIQMFQSYTENITFDCPGHIFSIG